MNKAAQIKAINKFNREKTKCIQIRLNKNTDSDILEQLERVPSKMGYIKELIRKDISRPE